MGRTAKKVKTKGEKKGEKVDKAGKEVEKKEKAEKNDEVKRAEKKEKKNKEKGVKSDKGSKEKKARKVRKEKPTTDKEKLKKKKSGKHPPSLAPTCLECDDIPPPGNRKLSPQKQALQEENKLLSYSFREASSQKSDAPSLSVVLATTVSWIMALFM